MVQKPVHVYSCRIEIAKNGMTEAISQTSHVYSIRGAYAHAWLIKRSKFCHYSFSAIFRDKDIFFKFDLNSLCPYFGRIFSDICGEKYLWESDYNTYKGCAYKTYESGLS